MLTRRHFLGTTAAAVAGNHLLGCSSANNTNAQPTQQTQQDAQTSPASASPAANAASLYADTDAQLITDTTAAEDGYFFPGEGRPHAATIMAMPPPQNWESDGFEMNQVRAQWATVANTIAEYEPVKMVVAPGEVGAARRLLNSEIEMIELPLNDGWTRDIGPMVVVNESGDRRIAGFTFNGWGEKFPPYRDDTLLKARLAAQMGLPMYPVNLVAEGGAILTDGEGTAIVTAQCLLHENRNPGYSREQVEALINSSLGTQKVIWVEQGLTPDPITDGHIDGLAAFAAPGMVLLHSCDLQRDPNDDICNAAKRVLEQTTDAKGRRLEIIDLPLARDISHMNFYICNGAVIVPIAEDEAQDDAPMAILREVFPDREVIGIGGNILCEGGGGIHCITQQVPAVG